MWLDTTSSTITTDLCHHLSDWDPNFGSIDLVPEGTVEKNRTIAEQNRFAKQSFLGLCLSPLCRVSTKKVRALKAIEELWIAPLRDQRC